MKLCNKLTLLNLLVYSLILISNISSKSRFRNLKHRQVVLGSPSAGNTVVSPLMEADELPFHSVINVAVNSKSIPTQWNVPFGMSMRHPTPIPASIAAPVPIAPLVPRLPPNHYSVPIVRPPPQMFDGRIREEVVYHAPHSEVTHVQTRSEQDIEFQTIDTPERERVHQNLQNLPPIRKVKVSWDDQLNEANELISNGNIDRSLDLYADALANSQDSQQENKILQTIIDNLNHAPENLVNKLEEKLRRLIFW